MKYIESENKILIEAINSVKNFLSELGYGNYTEEEFSETSCVHFQAHNDGQDILIYIKVKGEIIELDINEKISKHKLEVKELTIN